MDRWFLPAVEGWQTVVLKFDALVRERIDTALTVGSQLGKRCQLPSLRLPGLIESHRKQSCKFGGAGGVEGDAAHDGD